MNMKIMMMKKDLPECLVEDPDVVMMKMVIKQ